MRQQNLKYKFLTGLTSVGTTAALLADYFYTNEFHIESGFILATVALLLINLLGKYKPKTWLNTTLRLSTDIARLLLSIYCFYILLITLWGYGFTGRKIQPIWMAMAVSCSSIFTLAVIDFWRTIEGKTIETE